MRGRQPVGYVVQIDNVDVTLNLLDLHRGQVASHASGVSGVTEVGTLLAIDNGSRLLVMKVTSLSFAEPKEAHRYGIASSTHQTEPLRHVRGVIVGRLWWDNNVLKFVSDSLCTPSLGAEAYPVSDAELGAILGTQIDHAAPVILGTHLGGGGLVRSGLQDLIARHVAVLGASGQGKSSFTAAVLQQVVRLPSARIVIFDINGEYERAMALDDLPPDAVKITRLGDAGENGFRIPYYALGRFGLHRLLTPSEKTQRPALSFALEHLNKVRWIDAESGAGLAGDAHAYLFDDCRAQGAADALAKIEHLRSNQAAPVQEWPPMHALAALVAESYCLSPARQGAVERNAFNYSNVAPLVTRIRRLIEDPMFTDVVDVTGGPGQGAPLAWPRESSALVEEIFGGAITPWRCHIIDLRRVSHDLMPFVLGSLLELYAYELFRRGQENKIPTLLVLEEAHHYLRPIGSGETAAENALAYERLAKEGRKFGTALWLSTQRPSEISPTVLSQCNTWIAFRLSSEQDLAAVQAANEWADRRDVRRITGLGRQNAIVFGGSVSMPTLFRAKTADPAPRSEDAAFDDWGQEQRPDELLNGGGEPDEALEPVDDLGLPI